jgi:hypothetical protein
VVAPPSRAEYPGCTSISDEPSEAFMGAFLETFDYLGMHFGGVVHVNCQEGFVPVIHDSMAVAFAALVRQAALVTSSQFC